MARSRRRAARKELGKRVVYATPYRNLALEVVKMYQRKGELVEMSKEGDSSGKTVYVVYVFPR